jgi:NADH-quinone oxidoreductase subunit G
MLEAARDDRLPETVVRVATAHPSTAALGGMFDAVTLEKA